MERVTVASSTGRDLVSLDLAKQHLRITADVDDDLIVREIRAAQSWAESYARRPVAQQQFLAVYDDVPRVLVRGYMRRGFRLRGAVSSVDSVKYRDVAGALQTEASSVYTVVTGLHEATIVEAPSQSWSSPGEHADRWQVTFTSGWLEETAPDDVLAAVLFRLQHVHDGLDRAGAMAEGLLEPWRLPPW